MTLLQHFKQRLQRQKNRQLSTTCPNCWGYQEFSGRSLHPKPDRRKDVKNGLWCYGFIERFVKRWIRG